ncbi:MAG: diacylglycerol kinase family lipid kinase [Bacteroidales bacterium]|jgi:YegS/Rv2252/BmrU family lipid kinase|nr:diacylglycerol kinase family lipid kinase [Bacteroidales bacterium]
MEEKLLMDEWFAVVNPNAGNGKGKKDWKRIAWLLDKEGIKYSMKLTEKRGHATIMTRDLIRSGYRKFISVGGDGTLNEIVNGIFTQDKCPTTDCTISKIPVGTGNDWGRMFGIPLVYEGAVRVIREARQMKHDVGFINYYDGGRQEKRYFINIAGLGFESIVVKKTNSQKEKGKSNKAIYFWNLLSSLISYKNIQSDITIDGKTVKAKIFSLNVGNGRYCGGGMRQTPEAMPDDGLLDVTVIREIGRIEIIRNLKLLYDGTLLSHPRIDGYRCTNVKVESEFPLYVEADGESLGHTPAEFGIIPSAVNVIYATRVI